MRLPVRPFTVWPFVERIDRYHDPFRWTSEAQFSFEGFGEMDWKALTRAGYALAKVDEALHTAEDRKLRRWWKAGSRRWYAWMDIKSALRSVIGAHAEIWCASHFLDHRPGGKNELCLAGSWEVLL